MNNEWIRKQKGRRESEENRPLGILHLQNQSTPIQSWLIRAEEIVLPYEQIDEISTELKLLRDSINSVSDKTDKIMMKDDMQKFIKTTVEEIMSEINKGIEMTIECKLKECTKAMQKDLDDIKTVNRQLSEENQSLKIKLKNATSKFEAAEINQKLL